MKFRHIFASLIAAAALGACVHQLPPSKSFRTELANQYRAIKWHDQKYFASKTAHIVKGNDVQPEQPSSWNIPREEMADLTVAYDRLQIALVPDQKKVTSPIHAARAQAAFDCWVDQAHARWTPVPHGSDCRAAFYGAFCQMYAGKCNGGLQGDVYRVYFGTGKFDVSTSGRRVIRNAAAAYSKGGHEVVLAGHTDRTGSADYNMELSKARTASVRKLLMDNGVPADAITETYFGENQPMVKTGANTPNAHNRRVLIVIR